jgi:hypothetical protein
MLLLDAMASRCSTAAMRMNLQRPTGLAVAVQRNRGPTPRASRHPHVEGVIHRSGQEIVPCAFELIERGFTIRPQGISRRQLLAFTERPAPSSTPRASCWPAPTSGARR